MAQTQCSKSRFMQTERNNFSYLRRFTNPRPLIQRKDARSSWARVPLLALGESAVLAGRRRNSRPGQQTTISGAPVGSVGSRPALDIHSLREGLDARLSPIKYRRRSHPSQSTMEGRAWVAFWGGVSFSPSTPLGYSSQASASGRK